MSVASDIVVLRYAVVVAKFAGIASAAAAVGLTRAGLVSRVRRLQHKLPFTLVATGSRFTEIRAEDRLFLTDAEEPLANWKICWRPWLMRTGMWPAQPRPKSSGSRPT